MAVLNLTEYTKSRCNEKDQRITGYSNTDNLLLPPLFTGRSWTDFLGFMVGLKILIQDVHHHRNSIKGDS